MMKRSKSSRQWLQENHKDPFVKLAKQMGLRSRAAYKLQEIAKRDKLLRPGMQVVDLGAAPGGWSQIAAQAVGSTGRIWALDILPMEPLPGVEFIQGDFGEAEITIFLLERLQGAKIDLVICDIAPNISGINAVDQPRSLYFAKLALDFANNVLKPNGNFLVKLFQGQGVDRYIQALKSFFSSVQLRKPQASRSRSREVYLLAKGFKL